MDHVGFMPWTLLQLLAILAAMLLASIALNLGQ